MIDFDAIFSIMCNFCLRITSGTAQFVLQIISIIWMQIPDIILDTHFRTF